uniref:(northern house mosquito) hypothetical protein n=1 Tax=Culex pipiens TaxID=7175 RepID=A0A8D8E3C8_CULPI
MWPRGIPLFNETAAHVVLRLFHLLSSSFRSAAAADTAPPDDIEDSFSRPEAISFSTDLPFSSRTSLLMRVESASRPTERHFEIFCSYQQPKFTNSFRKLSRK